jgi:hypothetical protein
LWYVFFVMYCLVMGPFWLYPKFMYLTLRHVYFSKITHKTSILRYSTYLWLELNALVTSRNRPGFVYNQRLQPSRIPTQPETNLIGLQLTEILCHKPHPSLRSSNRRRISLEDRSKVVFSLSIKTESPVFSFLSSI